jgi:hypothetical protein
LETQHDDPPENLAKTTGTFPQSFGAENQLKVDEKSRLKTGGGHRQMRAAAVANWRVDEM